MKAKYIIEALSAMKDAERLGYMIEPVEFGRIIYRLTFARVELERSSGIGNVEIAVEVEAA